jgi:hypothetical protein
MSGNQKTEIQLFPLPLALQSLDGKPASTDPAHPTFNGMKAPLLLSTLFLGTIAHGQISITDSLSEASIAHLLEGFGVTITNVEVNCSGASLGHFTGSSDLPMTEGLLLTTGSAISASGTATELASENSALMSDPDLAALAESPIYDACVLSFDCIPIGDTLLFNYVFGSEEYPEYVCSFNDVFGLFLSGPEITGPFSGNAANLALLPGTQTPISINTVNNGNELSQGCMPTNVEYFIDNAEGTTIAYDGFTVNLLATVVVVPGETYHFKLAVGDAMDAVFDSGVFLEAFSFRSSGVTTGTEDQGPIQVQLLREADAVTVVFPSGNGMQEVLLLSASGTEVARYRSNNERLRVPTAQLPAGVYILQAMGDPTVRPMRFVVE